MIIVEQGKVVDICADPGEYTYDASTEPSIFAGSLGEGIRRTFQTIGKRFVFGGDTGKDQRYIILIPRSLWITIWHGFRQIGNSVSPIAAERST